MTTYMKEELSKLWTKEPYESTEIYVSLFERIMPAEPAQNLWKPAPPKDEPMAYMHRMNANKLFVDQKFAKAIGECHKSLRYAIPDTEAVGIAYGNRAGCFLHLAKFDCCLIDIVLAFQSRYPMDMRHRLMQRKNECMALRARTPSHAQKPKLSFPPNAQMPSMADVLEIQHNEEYGRHIVAKCDIAIDQIILMEPVYVGAGISYVGIIKCSVCNMGSFNLMPCKQCTTVMFCSNECLKRSQEYHGMECGYIPKDEIDISAQMLYRSILIALNACGNSVDELMTFVTSVLQEPHGVPTITIEPLDRYRIFLQSQTGRRLHHLDEARVILDAYDYITTLPKLENAFNTLAKRRFLMHLVLKHALIFKINNFEISNSERQNKGMCLMASLFNHQCAPNAYNFNVAGTSVVVTMREIKQGQQVFLSYLPLNTENLRLRIFESYGFWCRCCRCVPVPALQAASANLKLDEDLHFLSMTRLFKANRPIAVEIVLKLHCIRFLDKYGHLPNTDEVVLAMRVFVICTGNEYNRD